MSYFVACAFMEVYGMAIDTILVAFCQDRELNKDAGVYAMSKGMRRACGIKSEASVAKKAAKAKAKAARGDDESESDSSTEESSESTEN